LERVWAGADIGKDHHHVVVVDADGRRVFSRRVANDESVLLGLIGEVAGLAEELTWAIDVVGSESALLAALLFGHGQEVAYVPGMAVHRASAGYRGAGKTDAKDAYVIADQARMRRDLPVLHADLSATTAPCNASSAPRR
jgi:transposase